MLAHEIFRGRDVLARIILLLAVGASDFALGIAAFLLLFMWQTPPWLVVILSAAAGALMSLR